MIYLDHNATTPVLPQVREAMMPYLGDDWGNPSSTYRFGAKLKSKIEAAREQVANLIGCHSPREILFTNGGSESNNAAMKPCPAAHQSIRFSLGSDITASEIQEAISAIHRCIATLKA